MIARLLDRWREFRRECREASDWGAWVAEMTPVDAWKRRK